MKKHLGYREMKDLTLDLLNDFGLFRKELNRIN